MGLMGCSQGVGGVNPFPVPVLVLVWLLWWSQPLLECCLWNSLLVTCCLSPPAAESRDALESPKELEKPDPGENPQEADTWNGPGECLVWGWSSCSIPVS